jgi:protein SCO1/2
MNGPSRITQWLVWGGLALIALFVAVAVLRTPPAARVSLPVVGKIASFQLTNQNGEGVSLEQLKGKVWVADTIFTRCPGPCRRMTAHFREIQTALPAVQPARLVSISSDPDYDTPAVLKKYGGEFGADPARWWFLTGSRQQVYDLAVRDFKFVIAENKTTNGVPPAEGIITHSTWFALVDQQGQMRGWTDSNGGLHATFDSENEEERARLVAAIKQLLRDPKS